MNRIVTLLSAATLFMACEGLLEPARYSVEYRVTGSAPSVSVTYVNASGGTSQATGCGLPWSYKFTGYPDQFVYISAQNEDWEGSVTSSIYLDGKLWKTSTSTGSFVIATSSGLLP